jgi:D-sedoheptulose 7-phosphate isomerase
LIKAVLFDIDGVLTDGTVSVDQDGREVKRMSLIDIDAVHDIKRQGFIIGAITGESAEKCSYFKKRFPWDYFYSGIKNKLSIVKEIEEKTQLTPSEICYIGDGWYDIDPLSYVGMAVCPRNAIPEAIDIADICLNKRGGDGCIWELRGILFERKNMND